jgi:predicted anti-sigma-YlaC factor YlaD
VTCAEARGALGAFVLGALEPEERGGVEEHLRACPACTAEWEEFRLLPALLDQVPAEDLEPVVVAPSPELFERMSAAAAVTGRPRPWRSRTRGLVAAAVLAVLGIGIGVILWLAGAGVQSATASAGPVRATVTTVSDDDGISLDVAVAGLRPGETCRMLVVDKDGGWHDAGTWPASEDGDGRWRGWAGIDDKAMTEVVLTGDGGRTLVRVPF